ncbi:MAG: hypothetical protein JO250_15390 [Armatimonadetes bacterium]|nr:hypothetical protein [Armatimonadota bacterium]
MAQTTLGSVVLQFMRDWDAGKERSLQDYVARHPGDADELTECIADWAVFSALAAAQVMPSHPGSHTR